jgi:hypothetical protein
MSVGGHAQQNNQRVAEPIFLSWKFVHQEDFFPPRQVGRFEFSPNYSEAKV